VPIYLSATVVWMAELTTVMDDKCSVESVFFRLVDCARGRNRSKWKRGRCRPFRSQERRMMKGLNFPVSLLSATMTSFGVAVRHTKSLQTPSKPHFPSIFSSGTSSLIHPAPTSRVINPAPPAAPCVMSFIGGSTSPAIQHVL
jgi:hypothetical protein